MLDWEPSKGSLNKFVKTGGRSKAPPGYDDIFKKDQDKTFEGVGKRSTVRFEMPFNVWCLTCNNHIGTGTSKITLIMDYTNGLI